MSLQHSLAGIPTAERKRLVGKGQDWERYQTKRECKKEMRERES